MDKAIPLLSPIKFRQSLGLKFAVFLSLVLVLFMGISSFVVIRTQKNIFDKHLNEKTQMLGSFVALISPEALLNYDFALLNNFMKEAQQGEDISFSVMFDPKGNPLTSYLDRDDPVIQAVTSTNSIRDMDAILSALQQDNSIKFLEFPIIFQEKNLGKLVVGVNQRRLLKETDAARKILIIVSFIVIVSLALFIFLIFRLYVLSPVVSLMAAAHRVTSGNLDEAVTICARDELGRLAESFNQMMANRKEVEEELRALRNMLYNIIDSMPSVLIGVDTNDKVTQWNKRTEQITGIAVVDAKGKNVFDVYPQMAAEMNTISDSIRTGQAKQILRRPLTSEDGTCYNDITIYPLADNGIKGAVIRIDDVTERVKTEKELLKIKKLDSIGILAGGIAHDFNNILAAILGNINIALFDEDLKDKTKKLLSEAERASLRAKDLTQQLLTFAKGGEPIKETSSLDDVIKDSANFVLHGDKVACRYGIPEDLWLVDIDKGQMSQVIQNIVLNASHAMPEGGIISVTCENVSLDDPNAPVQAGKFVKICIQDSGVGMPASIVEKIFDPYFSTKQEGSGLGLAITHSIIIKHGGHISAESSPGAGTAFTLYLPASEQTKAPSQEPEVHHETSSQAKILIMDDEEMVRTVTKEMLNHSGHEVELSENGAEAIKLYQEAFNTNNKFDLVIMDLTIPGGMGGEEAVRKVLNLDPDAKVIVSSGYSNDPIMANYKDYGFCSAIVKPYQLQELSKMICELID